MNCYDDFTTCYLDLASQIFNDPDYVVSPRGQKVVEKLGVKFILKDPRNRMPFVPERNFSVHYMIAELLWYLAGEDSTAWIANYSSFWNKISDDGKTANSAYGARIFKPHDRIAGTQFIQWDYVMKELRDDPDSRRAVIHIRSPWDSAHAKLDVPCTLTMQFFIRDKMLHMIVNMRSSDLILGLAYDVPAFTFFQEMLAMQLNVGLGTYTHLSNSLHIYERHFGMIGKMLKEDQVILAKMNRISRGPMPPLPAMPPTNHMCLLEKELRKSDSLSYIHEVLDEFCVLGCDNLDYWQDWARVLTSHRLLKLGYGLESIDMLNSTTYAGYHSKNAS